MKAESNPLAVSKLPAAPGSHFVCHRIQWGGTRKFFGAELREIHPGAGYDAIANAAGTGPQRVKFHDQTRYPNQGYSCIDCPHLLLSVTRWNDADHWSPCCSHPHYIELYGCPQSVADPKLLSAPPDCPMLGRKSEESQRRSRWHRKSSEIFWRYFYDARLNPGKHGFTVYRA